MPTEFTTPGVSIVEGGQRPPITGGPTSSTVFVGWTPKGAAGAPSAVRSFADYEQQFGGLDARCAFGHSVLHYFANGGVDARILRLASPDGADVPVLPGTAAFAAALAAPNGLGSLDAAEFNLLCAPGEPRPEVLARLLQYCVTRRAFLIADAPNVLTAATAIADLQSLPTEPGSANAAVYWPWVLAPDPLAGNTVTAYPPSGFVAGVYARTDTTRGVWKSPAGPDALLQGSTGVSAHVDEASQSALQLSGINVLREFPSGRVVWGARTLRGADVQASEWKYVPVRRSALYIESSLDAGLDWTVFEPNDEALWDNVRLAVGEFLYTLFRAGAFQGASPRDAYFVKCDRATMSADDVDAGRLIVLVGFAALKQAEFVTLRIEKRLAPRPAGPIAPARARWETLVVPAATRAALEASAAALLARGAPVATVLFVGARGSGKSRAAELIANDVGLHLYRIDLARVVSRYIGETEKNLDRALAAAEAAGAALLLDEADALFGPRTRVRDAHDRYANAAAATGWLSSPHWPPVFVETRSAAALSAPEVRAWRVIEFPAHT